VTETFVYDGMKFNYKTIGDGPSMVFCHGLGGDIDQPEELIGPVDTCQLIFMDSRGHGLTRPGGTADKLNFQTFADDLRALLDHLDISSAVIGGISMGAGVAAQFASRWPDRVEGLVLVRPAWLDAPMPPNLELIPYIAELLADKEPHDALGEFLSTRKSELKAIARVSSATLKSLCQQFTKTGSIERRLRLKHIPACSPIESWSEISDLQMPVLVVGNDRDPMHPYEFAEEWARNLSQSRLVKIPSKAENLNEHKRSFRKHFLEFITSLRQGD